MFNGLELFDDEIQENGGINSDDIDDIFFKLSAGKLAPSEENPKPAKIKSGIIYTQYYPYIYSYDYD